MSNVLPPDTDFGRVRIRSADPVIDRWDKQLAETGEIDITADMDEEDAAAFRAFAARMAQAPTEDALGGSAPDVAPTDDSDIDDDTPR